MNVVAHNLSAVNAQRHFGINTGSKARSTEKLSTGYKINRAADDAAGLSISEKMRRQIRGLKQGVENTQDGISLCQVADGALAEVNDMLHRITELSVKSANGTNSKEDRQCIQDEIDQILQEIDRIGDTTVFNEKKILDGSIGGNTAIEGNEEVQNSNKIWNSLLTGNYKTISEEVTLPDGQSISSETANAILRALSNYAIANEMDTKKYIFPANSDVLQNFMLTAHDNACSFSAKATNPSLYKSNFEKAKSELEIGFDSLSVSAFGSAYTLYNSAAYHAADYEETENSSSAALSAAGMMHLSMDLRCSHFYDYYIVAAEKFAEIPDAVMKEAGKSSLLMADLLSNGGDLAKGRQAAISVYQMLFTPKDEAETHTGADQPRSLWIHSGAEAGDGIHLRIGKMDTSVLGIEGLDVTTAEGAGRAITATSDALAKISENRSNIGAQQNRLEHTIANEENIVENTAAAESNIRDTDMAKEMVIYSNLNILGQAGLSMLSQANQSNQNVLNLLR